ncbi:putative selenium-dependent hydroxylase accessory protein YqeC [Clostridium tagluense]|uniref:selenium cofactor biosynthesis protein YqeC n=1 Tax=Clostridium tagluense TaxID=360422 RepID=UPI001CF39C7A|nr:selenium cofactor biosynthesis protein YqeC [Clostridium tagluense]MCB2312444.1 putative selenium-dependent hydroxylase accessory protein YqeC [Clostridium tagluense]MCB2317119.1 putative selenium-dependent hydroxylase accessory protein YqeC [Clostridium tagluense]MCB2321983.1 putative selenium-dependent hydroxylase accessory protein YqeC [Clostridium tagluense]MCB2326992.1 putative selenium-dependent hydroxylase accessory protein YqeC [Clostridium tagluense]MCB2331710.1 putative selenium-d
MMVSNYIGLVEKDILSIVGAGGKTTMMFKLAEELRGSNKILVTTTTKVYTPALNKYDFICTDKNDFFKYCNMKENGIYILGLGINDENKILGLSYKELDELAPYFDYILIEADGAKKKRLKAWNEFEPVIYGKTTKTIGIMDIQSLDMVINEDSVHRSKIFREITGAHEGEIVKSEHLSEIIVNPRGLFKGAIGERILYINKVEDPKDLTLAELLVEEINSKNKELLNSVFIGSLNNNVCYTKI